MGSRGAFNPSYGRTGGIPLNQCDYSCVGTLGRIKIIQCDKKTNNPTTTYSNTSNTTYYSFSKENNRIERIYYFKNHKLYIRVLISSLMKRLMFIIGIMDKLVENDMTSVTFIRLMSVTRD